MKLIQLSQKAHNIGFTIGADSNGLKLVPFNDKARAICQRDFIGGIDSMHNLLAIITLLSSVSDDLQLKAICQGANNEH